VSRGLALLSVVAVEGGGERISVGSGWTPPPSRYGLEAELAPCGIVEHLPHGIDVGVAHLARRDECLA
jgi:hypothetical protein